MCVGLKLGLGVASDRDPAPITEITARMLRKIPLGQIVGDLAALEASFDPDLLGKIPSRLESHAVPSEEPRVRRGPRGHAPEFWAGIAALYREALVVSRRATARYVAERARDEQGRPFYPATDDEDAWPARERVARKWIRSARQKGFLNPTIPGKAGESLEPRGDPDRSQSGATKKKERS